MQKVWFRVQTGWWYASLKEAGTYRQIKLVKAPDSREGRKLAEDELVRELSDRNYSQQRAAEEPSLQSWLTVGHVLRGFLKHSEEEHSKETAAWHTTLLTPFLTTWGTLRFSRLKKKETREGVDQGQGLQPYERLEGHRRSQAGLQLGC